MREILKRSQLVLKKTRLRLLTGKPSREFICYKNFSTFGKGWQSGAGEDGKISL